MGVGRGGVGEGEGDGEGEGEAGVVLLRWRLGAPSVQESSTRSSKNKKRARADSRMRSAHSAHWAQRPSPATEGAPTTLDIGALGNDSSV